LAHANSRKSPSRLFRGPGRPRGPRLRGAGFPPCRVKRGERSGICQSSKRGETLSGTPILFLSVAGRRAGARDGYLFFHRVSRLPSEKAKRVSEIAVPYYGKAIVGGFLVERHRAHGKLVFFSGNVIRTTRDGQGAGRPTKFPTPGFSLLCDLHDFRGKTWLRDLGLPGRGLRLCLR